MCSMHRADEAHSMAVESSAMRTFLLVAMLIGIGSGCDTCRRATGSCCKVCTDGKACGDSCIAKSSTCNVGGGCACNGLVEDVLDTGGE
jgi:hypothetical protein